MFQVVHCTNCGRSSKPNDEKTAFVCITLRHSEHCNSCRNSHEETRDIRFCSTRCMVLFVQRCGDRILKLENDLVTDAYSNSWVTEDRPGIGKVRVNKYVNPLDEPVSTPELTDPNPLNDLTAEEKRRLKENPDKYIHVIKDVRYRTGLGLKEAKDLVDRYRR